MERPTSFRVDTQNTACHGRPHQTTGGIQDTTRGYSQPTPGLGQSLRMSDEDDDKTPTKHQTLRVDIDVIDGYKRLLKRYKALLKYSKADFSSMLALALKNHLPYFEKEVAAMELREREGGTDQVTPRGGDSGDS